MSVFPLLHGGDIFRGLQMGDKNGFFGQFVVVGLCRKQDPFMRGTATMI